MSSDVRQILKSVEALSLGERPELLQQPAFQSHGHLISSIQGKYAHVRTSSDEFMERKRDGLAVEH